jgi:hypothetical protein
LVKGIGEGLTHELSKDTLDGSASKDGKGVASVRSDDSVVSVNGGLHTDGNGLLQFPTNQKT